MPRIPILALVALAGFISFNAAPASAATVIWAVESSQSWLRLNIPDQQGSNFDVLQATARVRNADGTAWTDVGGRRAPISGFFSTDLQGPLLPPTSIAFTPPNYLYSPNHGQHAPNPADWDPISGAYTQSNPGPAAFGGLVRAGILGTFNLDAYDFSMSQMEYALSSGLTAVNGSGQFFAPQIDITSQLVAAYGYSFFGTPLPSMLLDSGITMGANTTLGSLNMTPEIVGSQMVINISAPFIMEFNDGQSSQLLLNGTATGQIVAYAIPEPGSFVLAALGMIGLGWMGYRRRG